MNCNQVNNGQNDSNSFRKSISGLVFDIVNFTKVRKQYLFLKSLIFADVDLDKL